MNGILYAVEGSNATGSSPIAAVEAYDPLTNTWTPKALPPTAAFLHIANPEAPSNLRHRLRERRHGRSNGLDLTARKVSGRASERIDLGAP